MVCAHASGGRTIRRQGLPLQALFGLLPLRKTFMSGKRDGGHGLAAIGKICEPAFARAGERLSTR